MGLYWYGTKTKWNMLSPKEKQLYEIVCIQDDMNVYNEPVKIRPRICDRCGAPIKVYSDYCEYCGVAVG